MTLDHFSLFVDMIAVVAAAAAAAVQNYSVVYDYHFGGHFDSWFFERLLLLFAATLTSRYSCPYRLQMIALLDIMIPPIASPFAVVFPRNLRHHAYLSVIILF